MARAENKKCEPKDKFLQTVEEASDYFGLSAGKIRQLTDDGEGMKCVLYNGRKRLIKRTVMEQYLAARYEI